VLLGSSFAAFLLALLAHLAASPSAWTPAAAGLVLLQAGVLPHILRRLLRAEPLPAGELRQAIQRLSVRMGLPLREIYLWKGRPGALPNALAPGMAAAGCQLFINDAAVEKLSSGEAAAIAAHEIGHWRRRHGLLGLAFLLGFLFALEALRRLLGALDGFSPVYLATAGALALLAWGGFFPLISRSFELEADLAAAEAAGWGACLRALLRIEELSPEGARLPSLRHPAIRTRRRRIERLAASPAERQASLRRSSGLRRSIVAGLLLPAAILGAILVQDLRAVLQLA
jgi:STE24 endopeptidase